MRIVGGGLNSCRNSDLSTSMSVGCAISIEYLENVPIGDQLSFAAILMFEISPSSISSSSSSSSSWGVPNVSSSFFDSTSYRMNILKSNFDSHSKEWFYPYYILTISPCRGSRVSGALERSLNMLGVRITLSVSGALKR